MKTNPNKKDTNGFVKTSAAVKRMALTINEAAEATTIGREKLRTLIKKGYIKAINIGGLKIPCTELERFLQDSLGKDFSDIDNVCDMPITYRIQCAS